ncbi:FAD-dependent oxidoreductase [Desulfobacula phenolica]|uniref:NADPH-dependent 2,4-dienoyl-CoA reductase, sulfur reductase n=1 Tax=Desulfobacula phenolica TaxID=90732 RepID=A0A1H2IBK3_9BACT|nr:FAD-dependent oxidoreductase [Desulfobacula phenolica]SDU41228.1 NADPH-dependent 2,4-dienoyl-CoA reductase, sulfur reductase [Desulfobacula phenolica]
MKKSDIIIIGGGAAGIVAINTIHALNSNLSLTLIKDEEVLVNRCSIPYGIGGEKEIENYVVPNSSITSTGADLVIGRVKEIDKEKKEVMLQTDEIYGYKQLLLATGSRPLLPQLPGIESEKILVVRSLGDLERLRASVRSSRKVLIVGGGYVGVELATELQQLGLTVSLVEMQKRILLGTTEPEFIDDVEQILDRKGIRVMTGRKVTAFEHDTQKMVTARLDDGTLIEADFVVISAGVVPNMELAQQAGIETSPLGIITDTALRTSDKYIFAAGDCAQKHAFGTGKPTRGDFGTNAVFMGKVAGQNLAGMETSFMGIINANVSSIYDTSFGSAGLTEEGARKAGLDVIVGLSETLDRYPMIDGAAAFRTKLIFDRTSRVLIGGSVIKKGKGVAPHIDLISLAIQKKITIEEFLCHQYATHPQLAVVPTENSCLTAAMNAMASMASR